MLSGAELNIFCLYAARSEFRANGVTVAGPGWHAENQSFQLPGQGNKATNCAMNTEPHSVYPPSSKKSHLKQHKVPHPGKTRQNQAKNRGVPGFFAGGHAEN